MSQDTEQEIKRARAKIKQYLETPRADSSERALSANDTVIVKTDLLFIDAQAGNAHRDRMAQMGQVRGKDQTRAAESEWVRWNETAKRLAVENPWLRLPRQKSELARRVIRALGLPVSKHRSVRRRLKV